MTQANVTAKQLGMIAFFGDDHGPAAVRAWATRHVKARDGRR